MTNQGKQHAVRAAAAAQGEPAGATTGSRNLPAEHPLSSAPDLEVSLADTMQRIQETATAPKEPVVAVAERLAQRSVIWEGTLSTGVRARLVPVSPSVMDMVAGRIPSPQVPMWHNPEKDRDEPNPADPAYALAIAKANNRKAQAFLDALVMFGVELLDPVPEDDDWLDKLRMLFTIQGLVFDYDISTPLARAFVYKKLVAVAAPDIMRLSEISGMGGGQIEEAVASFRRSA